MNETPKTTDAAKSSDECVRVSGKKVFLLSILALALSILSSLAGGLFAIVFTVFASACAAAALILSGSRLPLLVAPFAYIAAGLLSGSLDVALASLDFILAAGVAADAFIKKRSRVGIICRVSAALAIFEMTLLVLWIISTYGGISYDILRAIVVETHTKATDAIFASFSYLPEQFAVFSRDSVAQVVAYFFVLVPSMFITAYNIVAYFIQRTTITVCRAMKAEAAIAPVSRVFAISRAAAVTYIVSYLMTVFFAGGGGVSAVSAVLDNIIIVFTPGLALFGVKDYLRRFKERRTPMSVLFAVAMVFLLFTVPPLFFGLSAFSGAWAAFRKQ